MTKGLAMVTVTIDGMLTTEAKGIKGYWNGFAEPVFTEEQMHHVQNECIRLGWVIPAGIAGNALTVNGDMQGWQYLGWDEYTTCGWVWTEVAA